MAGYGRRDDAGSPDSRVYVGNLPSNIRERDLTDIFYKYGDIANIDLKRNANGMGNPYAFVEFRDHRDAVDAKEGKDGCEFDGQTLRVQYPRAPGSGRGGMRGGFSDRGGRGRGGGGGFGNNRPKGPPPRRSNYRCFVSGLPGSGSWQDLKDHMREAGDVCFTDVYNDGTGVVEFLRREDMEYACSRLNHSKFRSHEGESTTIRVKADDLDPLPGRSRSISPRRRGGYSPPPNYQSNYQSNYRQSRSRSRSRHHSYTRSRSRD